MTISKIEVRGEETPDDSLYHFHLALVGEDGAFIRLDNAPSYTDMSCPMRGLLRVEYNGLPWSLPLEPEVFVALVREGTDAATLCRYLLDERKVEQYMYVRDLFFRCNLSMTSRQALLTVVTAAATGVLLC